MDDEVEDRLQAIKDVAGQALLDLNDIEKDIPTILKDIADKEAEIEKLIVAKWSPNIGAGRETQPLLLIQ